MIELVDGVGSVLGNPGPRSAELFLQEKEIAPHLVGLQLNEMKIGARNS